tara:strand:- start:74 stop:286 length:213 start_codon:yes stop_codon:yes gene_type:complete
LLRFCRHCFFNVAAVVAFAKDAEDGRGRFNAAARGAAFGAAAAEEDAEAELACFAMHVLMRRFSAVDNEL